MGGKQHHNAFSHGQDAWKEHRALLGLYEKEDIENPALSTASSWTRAALAARSREISVRQSLAEVGYAIVPLHRVLDGSQPPAAVPQPTTFGTGTHLLPCDLSKPAPILPPANKPVDVDMKHIISQQATFRPRKTIVGEGMLQRFSPAEEAMAILHGYNCARNTSGLDFTEAAVSLRTSYVRNVGAQTLRAMFLKVCSLKNVDSVRAVCRSKDLQWLLQGYVANCKSINQLYAFATFARIPLSMFGDPQMLGFTVTPETVKDRKKAWRAEVLGALAVCVWPQRRLPLIMSIQRTLSGS